ncbi:MAG: S9 family peptidase [Gammaproteobacteria bacterium]|nr:S9 family peptidase [Gammaproteobacteria bacterium]
MPQYVSPSLVFLATLFAILPSKGHSQEVVPYTAFGQLPIVEQPNVSPNGEFVAVIVNSEQGPVVNVAPFGSREMTPIIRLKYGEDRIEWIHWANEERLLIASSKSNLIGGDRVRASRLYSVDRDGKGLKELKRKTLTDAPWWSYISDTSNVVSFLPDDPKHILLQLYDDLDEANAVFKVNIYKNKFKKLFPNVYDVSSWEANSKGDVVFGVGRDKSERTIWFRPNNDAEWSRLHSYIVGQDETFDPAFVDGDKLLVFSDHEIGRQGLWRYDIPTGEFEELVFAPDDHDISGAIWSKNEDKLVGAWYYDDFRVDHYIDESYFTVRNVVKQSFPTYQTSIASHDQDRRRLIVAAVRDDSPPKYFWLDLDAKKGGIWFSKYPFLEKVPLAPVTPYEFEASDGMLLNGYLTMPVTSKGDKPAVVVLPHGGPHARDYRYFDPYVQFFANRGYAVLQVNFRGSAGFGNNYEIAGYREWGASMQQDVYDALAWLEDKKIADTDNVCMVGGSYGGYVALTAAFQKPDRFKCIVSMAGISDLLRMASLEYRNEWTRHIVVDQIGDPSDPDDDARLRNNSPINHVAKVKSPVLLIHGTHDTRVRTKQSRDYHSAARRAGVDTQYIELKYGTHFFDEYDNRLKVFEALDNFLRKHL